MTEYTTPDGYDIEDILVAGRCIICGHIAKNIALTDKYGASHKLCDNPECKEQLSAVLIELDA